MSICRCYVGVRACVLPRFNCYPRFPFALRDVRVIASSSVVSKRGTPPGLSLFADDSVFCGNRKTGRPHLCVATWLMSTEIKREGVFFRRSLGIPCMYLTKSQDPVNAPVTLKRCFPIFSTLRTRTSFDWSRRLSKDLLSRIVWIKMMKMKKHLWRRGWSHWLGKTTLEIKGRSRANGNEQTLKTGLYAFVLTVCTSRRQIRHWRISVWIPVFVEVLRSYPELLAPFSDHSNR